MKLALSNHALYMPAISSAYARYGYGQRFKNSYDFTEKQLNFLDPNEGMFNYPYALYSAGQAAATDGAAQRTTFITKKERYKGLTTIIGDSGGFQIQQGTIKFEGNKTCERILRWLEGTADYSMTLDFPTGGIGKGRMEAHRNRLTRAGHDIAGMTARNGQSLDFNAALKQSILNLDYFVTNRKAGATKFLNVLQGRNEDESKAWYEEVKGFDLEGWAFAGLHQCTFSMVLNRLLDMWDDGYLQKAEWIHFLGISTFPAAYLFTAILRCIRQVNPAISISFDTSNAFTTAVNGLFYAWARQDKRVSKAEQYKLSEVAPEDEDVSLNDLCAHLSLSEDVPKQQLTAWNNVFALPANTHIGSKVRMSDLLSPRIQGGSRRMTSDGITFLMNHNADFLLRCFRRLNSNIDNSTDHEFMPPSAVMVKACIEQVFQAAFIDGNMVMARNIIGQTQATLDRLAIERFQ
ncbi:hypothetical protein Q9314_08190 [Shinella sumterensis]|nr:hypothetical protein Q9314_08190 [Shinella sumterensis]